MAGNIFYYAAMRHLTAATSQIIFSSILLFNAIFAIAFQGLHLSVLNIIGVCLLMVAIIGAVSGKTQYSHRGTLLMIASAACFSLFQIGSGNVAKYMSVPLYLLISYGVTALGIYLLKWRMINHDIFHERGLKTTLVWSTLACIPSLGNFIFAFYAYRLAEQPGKVAILLTAQVIVAVLLSIIFLGERTKMWRKLGTASVAVIAAMLIKA